VVRSGAGTDSVAASWWTNRYSGQIAGTSDPELYRYGVHAPEFWVNLTAGPGRYALRLRFCATHLAESGRNLITVKVNGREVASGLDVAKQAGGSGRAYDLMVPDVTPRHGIVEVRFSGGEAAAGVKGQAFVQAIELLPSRRQSLRGSRSMSHGEDNT
jgi:hypothetical protein